MYYAKSVTYTHKSAQLRVGDGSKDKGQLGSGFRRPLTTSSYCAHKTLMVEMSICYIYT